MDSAHHVVSDVQAEGSSCVVDEGCRVDGEGRHADVQHVVDLGRQGKGYRGERRLLMLPDVVKLTLNDGETSCNQTQASDTVHYSGQHFFLYLQAEVYRRIRHCGRRHHGVFNLCILVHLGYNCKKLQSLSYIRHQ